MKKLLATAVAMAALGLSCGAGYAGNLSESSSRVVSGDVPNYCNWTSTNTAQYDLTNFATDGNVTTSAYTIPFGTIGCSAAAKVKIGSNHKALKRQGSSGSSCSAAGADCISYIASSTWNGASANYAADGTVAEGTYSNAASHGYTALDVSLQADSPTVTLNTGTFQDTITVTVAIQ